MRKRVIIIVFFVISVFLASCNEKPEVTSVLFEHDVYSVTETGETSTLHTSAEFNTEELSMFLECLDWVKEENPLRREECYVSWGGFGLEYHAPLYFTISYSDGSKEKWYYGGKENEKNNCFVFINYMCFLDHWV